MSQTTGTQAGPGVNPYSGPGITMETKLMKQYRLASPVNAGSEGVAVCNKDGQIELFTVGTNYKVWNFSPDPSSDTGYRLKSTGLSGGSVAAGMDQDGRIVVFASPTQGALSYAVKNPDGTFAAAKPVDLPRQSTSQGSLPIRHILELHARTIDGRLYVAALGLCSANIGSNYTGMPYLALSNWSVDPGRFHTTPTAWPSLPLDWFSAWPSCGFWTRHTQLKTPIGFSFYIHGPNLQSPNNGFVTFHETCELQEFIPPHSPDGVSYASYGWVTSAAVDLHDLDLHRLSRNRIYVTTSPTIDCRPDNKDDKLSDVRSPYVPQQSRPGYATTAYTRQQLIPGPGNLARVRAVHDHNEGKEGTHLFCVSTDHKLYHLPPNPHIQEARPQLDHPPLPIKKNVRWVAVARNDAGNIELFCAQDEANAPLLHLTLDQETGDWGEQKVGVQSPPDTPSTDKLEEFISYSTDISFTDTAAVPLANAAVTIRACDRTAVTVNNATYPSVDAATSASVTADALGKLTITQQTSGLGVPDLWLHVDKLMPADQVLVLQQHANGRDDAALPRELKSVEARLKDVKADELAGAKDASGKYLLKDSVRNSKESTEALAGAFNKCMQLRSSEPKTATAALHPLISRRGTWTGLHIVSPAEALERLRVIPHDGLPSWVLSFEEDAIHHRMLTREEAQAMMVEMHANARPAASAEGKSFWSTIGDFFRAVVEGVVKIAKMVVDGVKATFNFIIEGVTYVFEAVVGFVQQSFDMIQSILATVYDTVADFFERTFEWIGFLFDWQDILRTQEALCHVIDETLKFLGMAAPAIQKRVDAAFGTALADIGTYFDDLIAKTDTKKTFGSVVKENDRHDPVVAHSLGNNVINNTYMSNWQGAKASTQALATVNTSGLDDLWLSLQQFATDNQKKPEWQSTTAYYESGFRTQDGFLTEGLKSFYELLKNLALAVVSGAQTIIDKLLEQISAMINALRQAITAEVHIPLVSELFERVAGRPLTALNVIALLAAIPTTILYKALNGAAPFPDESSVNDFKATFTAQWMFDAAGLGTTRATERAVALPDPKFRSKLRVVCGSMTIISGVFAAALDSVSGVATMEESGLTENLPYEFFSMAGLLMNFGVQGCNCPYIFEESPHWAVKTVWLYETIGSLGLDLIFFVKGQVLAKNSITGPSGVVLATIYGVLHLGLVILKLTQIYREPWGIIIPIAEISRILLWKPFLMIKQAGPVFLGTEVALTLFLFTADGVFKIANAQHSPLGRTVQWRNREFRLTAGA